MSLRGIQVWYCSEINLLEVLLYISSFSGHFCLYSDRKVESDQKQVDEKAGGGSENFLESDSNLDSQVYAMTS